MALGDSLDSLLNEVTTLYGKLVRVSEYRTLAEEARAAIEEVGAAVAAISDNSGEKELQRVRDAVTALNSVAAKIRQARQR